MPSSHQSSTSPRYNVFFRPKISQSYSHKESAFLSNVYLVMSRFCSCDLDLDALTLIYQLDLDIRKMCGQTSNGLSLWLNGLIRFLSHSTCWVYLAGDLQTPGIKSRSWHELSVGWTNGRYAMRLISRTCTEGPPVSSLNCDRCRL